MSSFAEGYEFFTKNTSSFYGAHEGNQYIGSIQKEINKLKEDMHSFQHFKTDVSVLKGDVAEFWHSGTHNIDAAVKGVKARTFVDRSHDFASADIVSSEGTAYGLKYFKTGAKSAESQSESIFQRYAEYKANAIKADRNFQTLEEYMAQRGYDDSTLLHDSIYTGQVRIIPKDQMQDAISWLERKIHEESAKRPEQVQRYKDTLALLKDRISSVEGSESIPLSREDAEKLARLAKNGEFDPTDFGLSTEELVNYQHILKQGFKAGLTAATITMLLKVTPEIYKAIQHLIQSGKIDEMQLKEMGLTAIQGASEGFLLGSISASITTACKSGIWGSALKSVNPAVVATITVLVLDVMKNSYLVARGKKSREELVDSLVRGLYISSCSLLLGGLTQSLIHIPVFGFMLGSFIGSMVGSFSYNVSYQTYIGFCVNTGFTMFGAVKQDYELPVEVLTEIGLDVFEYETFTWDEFTPDTFEIEEFSFEEFQAEEIDFTFLRRGVIGVNHISYV